MILKRAWNRSNSLCCNLKKFQNSSRNSNYYIVLHYFYYFTFAFIYFPEYGPPEDSELIKHSSALKNTLLEINIDCSQRPDVPTTSALIHCFISLFSYTFYFHLFLPEYGPPEDSELIKHSSALKNTLLEVNIDCPQMPNVPTRKKKLPSKSTLSIFFVRRVFRPDKIVRASILKTGNLCVFDKLFYISSMVFGTDFGESYMNREKHLVRFIFRKSQNRCRGNGKTF